MTTPDYRPTVFLPRTPFPMKAGLAASEPVLVERWRREGLYAAVRAARAGAERFVLQDGPIYANGDIHVGHAMNRILKDFVVRSRTLLGFDAPFVPGFDCHGLPIEWKVEEAFRAAGRAKGDVPVGEFRAACRAFAARWVAVQSAQFERLGVLGDWDAPYNTMDYASEAAIVGEFLRFAGSGQLYRGAKPVMWSPVEGTALAEAEVEYADVVSTQVDVAFEIVECPKRPELVGTFAVVWTTTPWTLPVNQAIAFGPEVRYGLVEFEAYGRPQRFLIARELAGGFADRLSRSSGSVVLLTGLEGVVPGTDLEGAIARHALHHLGGFFATPRPFLPGTFVTTDQGTGLVHMAPDHGEDDFALCAEHGIGPVFAVEGDGRYRADWAWLGGEGSVINTKFNAPDGPICSDLRAAGALLSAGPYPHSYPHSWRSKARLIQRATPQWFIAIDRPLPLPGADAPVPLPHAGEEQTRAAGEGEGTLRDVALAEIGRTRWVPAKGENRIRAMVEGRPDWLISRQRAWGVPLTLFVDRRTGAYLRDPEVDRRIVAAVAAGGAEAWLATDAAELLGPGYDPDGYERVTDILDVWFDSGSTHAFVTEARLGADQADLYLEGSDQHRGWFQSSLLESCGTRGRAPYKAVLTHGFVLDADGRKMSKSLGNATDPLKVMETAGADILRLWVATTDYAEDVRIGGKILDQASDLYRKLRNTLRYLLGALDGFESGDGPRRPDGTLDTSALPELERWVLHRLTCLDGELRAAVEAYEFTGYVRAIAAFAQDDLSALVFDIRKDRLYCDVDARTPGGARAEWHAYRAVLDVVFGALVRWLAPILPFTAEEAWALRHPGGASVHLATWPAIDRAWTDAALEASFDQIKALRGLASLAFEDYRRAKEISSSLQLRLIFRWWAGETGVQTNDDLLTEYLLAGEVTLEEVERSGKSTVEAGPGAPPGGYHLPDYSIAMGAIRLDHAKCGRCWRHRPEVGALADPNLCDRCHKVVGATVLGVAA